MGNRAINSYDKQANTFSEWVWFDGTTALLEGQGLCYNFDYGTAASSDARRGNRVELPTILNAMHFAGVAARPYAANSGGQLIEIYTPGSICNVLSRVSNTLGVGATCCIAGGTYAGYFDNAGFPGKGNAVPLQTIDRSSTAGLCLARLEDGEQSGLIDLFTPTAGAISTLPSLYGITYFQAATIASDCTFTLADGTKVGQRKGFVCEGEPTTSTIIITVTSGLQMDGTALSTITFEDIQDYSVLRWDGLGTGALWAVQSFTATEG
jgi:hypothetical protein